MKKLIIILLMIPSFVMAQSSCNGRFINLLTDVCWDCVFPLSMGGMQMNFGFNNSGDYDSGASKSPICTCANNLMIGTPMSLWEPSMMFDVTNKPGCMPLLGTSINTPINSNQNGSFTNSQKAIKGSGRTAFMHVNEYINPILTTIGLLYDSPCLDNRSYDIPYMSWADPSWNDDAMSMLMQPWAYGFTSILAVAAEGPDAVAANAGFPIASLFWVAGSWGAMYPTTGNVATFHSQEQANHLLVTRLLAKLHATGLQQSTAGQAALASCGALGVPEFIMDKRQYKISRSLPYLDNMCMPIGRSTIAEEAGANRPLDKDYGYVVFRKKDCCAGYTP
jgi:conjugal transfer pilus assembly protein TraU